MRNCPIIIRNQTSLVPWDHPPVFLSWNMGIESPAPVAVSAMEIVKTQ
jgi:hypothetical protein